MKLMYLLVILLFAACSSEKARNVAVESPKKSSETLVSDEQYAPIESGLDIVIPKKETQKKDQLEVILQNHLMSFPFYNNESPKNYEKKLADSFRKAKDELDSYYLQNLKAIESKIVELPNQELMTLEEYISIRYITVQKKLAFEFINYFFDYKKNYSLKLLNVNAFDNKLIKVCGFVEESEDGIQDADDLVEEELDAYDEVSKRALQDYWGDTTYVFSRGLKPITLSEALITAKRLENLREDIYDYTHCTSYIQTAQKLYSYLLTSDSSVFKTKYLSRDPQKAEQQANLISEYVENILKLVSTNEYKYSVHGKLAKQYSRSFEAKMILYGPWAEKALIRESLSPYIYISLSEKFLESSGHSDKKFYSNIRCSMYKYNHFAIKEDDSSFNYSLGYIPLDVICN